MPAYQGRALQTQRRGPRPGRTTRALARAGLLAAVAAILAHVPWKEWRQRVAVVREVRVEGVRYLEPARIGEVAGLRPGDDLMRLDLKGARQALLLDSRIAAARVSRRLLRGVRIEVRERVPAMLVHHGTPWEIDSTGMLLAPLQRGVVADVPLLVGPSFEHLPAGTQVRSAEVERGLAWLGALSVPPLELSGQVSEVDVSRSGATGITLLSGTRVIAPAWPPPLRRLSALRVVLADLRSRGAVAEEVDLRFENQVIVRPAAPPPAEDRNG